MSTLEFNDALVNMESNLKSFAMRFTKSPYEAEDLTQETMMKALIYRKQYVPQTNFKAWVFTIMRNVFINQYRRKQKSSTIFDHSQEMFLLNNHSLSQDETMHYIMGKELNLTLQSLDEGYQKPFQMHFEGYKYEEIAEKLRIPIGTVKSRIFVARKKLTDALNDYKYLAN